MQSLTAQHIYEDKMRLWAILHPVIGEILPRYGHPWTLLNTDAARHLRDCFGDIATLVGCKPSKLEQWSSLTYALCVLWHLRGRDCQRHRNYINSMRDAANLFFRCWAFDSITVFPISRLCEQTTCWMKAKGHHNGRKCIHHNAVAACAELRGADTIYLFLTVF